MCKAHLTIKEKKTAVKGIKKKGGENDQAVLASAKPAYTTKHGATREVKAPYKKVAG